jgi:hypothetical protein
VNVTVTSALFHPLPFGNGDRACEIVGAVLSIRTVTVCAVSVFPATSTLQNNTVCDPVPDTYAANPVCLEPPSTL